MLTRTNHHATGQTERDIFLTGLRSLLMIPTNPRRRGMKEGERDPSQRGGGGEGERAKGFTQARPRCTTANEPVPP